MLIQLQRQIASGNFGKARHIFNGACQCHLPAWYRRFAHDDGKPLPAAIDRGGQPGRAGADDEKISLFHGLRILQSEKNMHTKRKNFLYSTRFDRLLGQGLVQCACSLSNTSSFHIQVRPIRANPTTFALHRPVEGAFFVRHLSAAYGGTSPLGEALGCEGSP